MPTKQESGAKSTPKSERDRGVWDVAREAFENSLIEGDHPAARRKPKAESRPG